MAVEDWGSVVYVVPVEDWGSVVYAVPVEVFSAHIESWSVIYHGSLDSTAT